jgi:uncharacterized protein YidB (DUF937 family)
MREVYWGAGKCTPTCIVINLNKVKYNIATDDILNHRLEGAMGFLDDLTGKVKEAVGGSGGEHSALMNEVLELLSGDGDGAGLQGLIQSLKDKGLGDLTSSWIGTGRNLPVSAEQLKNGLGSDVIGRLAAKAGTTPDVVTSKLTQILPGLIDKLTPEGKVPESGLLQQGLDLLRSNLPKWS